jgi:hypothetical protein
MEMKEETSRMHLSMELANLDWTAGSTTTSLQGADKDNTGAVAGVRIRGDSDTSDHRPSYPTSLAGQRDYCSATGHWSPTF